MKTLKLVLGVVVVLLAVTTMKAQDQSVETHVRILPHPNEGYLRLLYVGENVKKATVAIKQNSRTFGYDYVRVNESDNGFIKSYDLSDLKSGSYIVEVSANGTTSSESFEIIKNEPIWMNYWKTKLNINNNGRLASTKKLMGAEK